MKAVPVMARVAPWVREEVLHVAVAENRSVSNYVETLILADLKRKGIDLYGVESEWHKAVATEG